MDFRQMRYVVEVAECRSVTRAADNLHVSQSAVSHYIRHAEDSLGVKLFDRSANPLGLTYAGMVYVESAKRILTEHDGMKRRLRESSGHVKRLLRIGTSRDRASYMLPKIIPEFMRRCPGTRTEIFTESGQVLRERLKKGRIDILMLPDDGKEISPNINAEIIYTEELLLVSKKGFLKIPDGRKYVYPSGIDGFPFFMQYREHTTRLFCDAYFRDNDIQPDIVMEFPSNITCYRMASAGLGLAIVPMMITGIANPESKTELYSLSERPRTWDILAYTRKDIPEGQPEQDFIRTARNRFLQGDTFL